MSITVVARAMILIVGLWAAEVNAASITLINADGPGEGLNDTTPAVPVDGNAGLTVGDQRLLSLQAATEVWASQIDSAVQIRIRAHFDPASCLDPTLILGRAKPEAWVKDFANAPLGGTFYPIALANALAGGYVSPAIPVEIDAQFNTNFDSGACIPSFKWWYGIDRNVVMPASRINLVDFATHEIAHGLGFMTRVDLNSGQYPEGRLDVWAHHLFDMQTSKLWAQMTPAERVLSAKNDPYLTWQGDEVTANLSTFLRPQARMTARLGDAALSLPANVASFGTIPSLDGFTAPLATATDAVGSIYDACDPLNNVGVIRGRIALIEALGCANEVKALNAQNAGAVGVIIASTDAFPTSFDNDTRAQRVNIPVYGVSSNATTSLRAQGPGTVTTTLHFQAVNNNLQGTWLGRMRMHAPTTLSSDSVNHFSIDAFPHALMEPFDYRMAFRGVDLALPLLRDIGWQLPRNRAPTIAAPDTQVVTEDTAKALLDIVFGDPDAGTAAVLASAQVSEGTLSTLDNVGVSITGRGTSVMTFSGTIAAINTMISRGSLVYTPAPNATATVSLRLDIDDLGNSGSGGALISTVARTITINAVNDRPTLTLPAGNAIAVSEDLPSAIAGIAVADVDAGAGPVTLTFTVTQGTLSATPQAGITIGSAPPPSLTIKGTVGDLNAYIAAGRLSYLTALDASGTRTLTVHADDNGNTGSGVAGTADGTITLTIAAINDAPTISAPAAQLLGSAAGTFALRDVSIADVDAGSGTLTLTLSVPSGSLAATCGAGVTVTGGGASVTLTGTIATLNTCFTAQGVTYALTADDPATAVVQYQLNDNGNTGGGGARTATASTTLQRPSEIVFKHGFE